MNNGEGDELYIKLCLLNARDQHNSSINSVGFAGPEYKPLPFPLTTGIYQLNDTQLLQLATSLGCCKAPSSAKSDVYINNSGVSLKSSSAAPAALVNHTARPGFERVCKTLGIDIKQLDEIIDEYWKLRMSGKISEDTRITDLRCPFKNYKKYLKPILSYFLFTGTGSKDSPYPAQCLLEFSDPFNTKTWNILSPSEAVDAIWNKLIFSLRAKKGMPTDYDPSTYSGTNADSIARWTRFHSGDYRGALHIRSSR